MLLIAQNFLKQRTRQSKISLTVIWDQLLPPQVVTSFKRITSVLCTKFTKKKLV